MPCNCQSTKRVAQPRTRAIPASATPAVSGAARNLGRPAFASIRYTGPTSATATGPISGRQYRFTRTGATMQVDPRDKPALSKIPHLRQI